jgi:general secretion pathway protein L
MNLDLIIGLQEDGRLDWSIVDRRRGVRLHSGTAGDGETVVLPDTGGVDRTLVLLPSEAVFTGTVDLPARSEGEARQAAPFMIEEELASRLADTTVLPGPRGADGRRWVIAADTARVAAWRERIEPLAVRPVHVLPDCVAAAGPEAALTLFDRGDSILWLYGDATRKPGEAAGGAMDPPLFNRVVASVVRGAGGGGIAVSASLGLAGENFRQIPRGELDLMAAALPAERVAAMPALLGERLRSTLNWRDLAGPLKRPAALAAGLLLAFCLLTGGEAVYYRLQASRFDAAAVAQFRAAVPEVTRPVIPAEAERLLNGRLAALGGGDASPFLQLMAALSELTAANESVRIDHVRFDRGGLVVSALYSGFSDFDALSDRAESLGLRLEDGGARESGQAIEGEFTMWLR